MKNILEYKGYHAKIEFNADSFTIRGKIDGINDYIDFESDSLDKIEFEFHSAVDDYLAFCEEVGKSPEKEYKGSFNVRVTPELHKEAANIAVKNGMSLNSVVERAIQEYIDERKNHKLLRNSLEMLAESIQNTSKYKCQNVPQIKCENFVEFSSGKMLMN